MSVCARNCAVFHFKQSGRVVQFVFRAGEDCLEAVHEVEEHVLSCFVEFAEHVVEEENRSFAEFIAVEHDLPDFHCKRNRALLPLRSEFAAVLAVDFNLYVVAMRAYAAETELFVLFP